MINNDLHGFSEWNILKNSRNLKLKNGKKEWDVSKHYVTSIREDVRKYGGGVTEGMINNYAHDAID